MAYPPSTLTRLAKTLGCRGFAEFQAVFRRHVARTGHFYSGRVSRLRDLSGGQHQALDLLSRIAREERGNLQGLLTLVAWALGDDARSAVESREQLIRGMDVEL